MDQKCPLRNIFKGLQEAKSHVTKLISLKLMHWSADSIKISKPVHAEFVAIAIHKQRVRHGEKVYERQNGRRERWQKRIGQETEKMKTLYSLTKSFKKPKSG